MFSLLTLMCSFCSEFFFMSFLLVLFCWICVLLELARLFLLAQDTHLMPFMKSRLSTFWFSLVSGVICVGEIWRWREDICLALVFRLLFCFALPCCLPLRKAFTRGIYVGRAIQRGKL